RPPVVPDLRALRRAGWRGPGLRGRLHRQAERGRCARRAGRHRRGLPRGRRAGGDVARPAVDGRNPAAEGQRLLPALRARQPLLVARFRCARRPRRGHHDPLGHHRLGERPVRLPGRPAAADSGGRPGAGVPGRLDPPDQRRNRGGAAMNGTGNGGRARTALAAAVFAAALGLAACGDATVESSEVTETTTATTTTSTSTETSTSSSVRASPREADERDIVEPGATRAEEAPDGRQPLTADDETFLDALIADGIDVQGTEDQLIA